MANVKISELTGASAAAAANEYEINEAGTSKKVTGTQISAFVKADLLDDATVNFAGTLQNGGSNVVVDTDIGSTVQSYDADTAKTDIAQTYSAGQRGTITALTDGATITPDLAASNNFSVTLAGNRTLANPTNIVAGQSGSVFITQDGTGSRTLAFGSYWDFAGGTAPTLSTDAASVDRIDYVVRSATSIHAVFTAAYS
tara:strand:+ start:1319 stop:1915 length:597 start_codon:yes stop_codon:yes gene_type:complete